MADKKGKTKAAILQELESIKGLLLEEDVPVLQEPMSHEQLGSDRPLPKQDLKKLHHEFQALNNAISATPEKVNAELSEDYDGDYGDDETASEDIGQSSGDDYPTKKAERSVDNQYQASLFQNTTSEQQIDESSAAQKNRVAEPLNYAVKKSITPPPTNRQAVTKASGENPFLPQHIRERLQGNNPFPTFEFNEITPVYKSEQSLYKNEAVAAPSSAYKFEHSTVPKNDVSSVPKIDAPVVKENGDKKSVAQKDAQVSRHALIQDVVDAVLPQIELELRQRLEHMTEDQLLELLSAH